MSRIARRKLALRPALLVAGILVNQLVLSAFWKPGRLTPDEKRIMDSHVERGAELIARYSDFARGVEIVLHHHERWDGRGYPKGLKRLEIPFGVRIIAVVDSFDAMTSNRPDRTALSVAQASRVLSDGRGQQWDPATVDAFLRHLATAPLSAAAPLPDAAPATRAVRAAVLARARLVLKRPAKRGGPA